MSYSTAKAKYAKIGIDTEKAIKDLGKIAISLHCWQGDDVKGFEVHDESVSGGGIMAIDNGQFAMPEGNVTVTAAFTTLTVPAFRGNSLRFTDVLGLKYYLDLPDGFDNDGAYMTFTICGRTARVDLDDELDENGYKVFTCPVYTYQMADPVTAVFHWKDGTAADTVAYTVVQYLQSVIASDTATDPQKALASATLTYGHYVQPYLARLNNWTVGGKYQEIPAASEVTDSEVAAAKGNIGSHMEAPSVTINSGLVQKVMFFPNVNSGTDLVFDIYLKNGVTGEVQATVDGVSAGVTSRGNNVCRIAKRGIAANNLDHNYSLVLTVGGDTAFNAAISTLYYLNIVLNNTSAPLDEQLAIAAMYQYWAAAEACQAP